MYSFETLPAFRGATYSDELQMVHADTGAAVPFLPALDALTWRLLSADPTRRGAWPYTGWDYGLLTADVPDQSLVTLTLGQGLSITPAGTALWIVPVFPAWLDEPEYRMTLDLVRYGETCRVLDTLLQVER